MASKIPLFLTKTSKQFGNKQVNLLITRARATATSKSTVAENIRIKQEKYAVEDGTPVYLKGGAFDRALAGLTAGCCVLALGLIAKNLFGLIVKKK